MGIIALIWNRLFCWYNRCYMPIIEGFDPNGSERDLVEKTVFYKENWESRLVFAYCELMELTRKEVDGECEVDVEISDKRKAFKALIDEKKLGEDMDDYDWLVIGIIGEVSEGGLEKFAKDNSSEGAAPSCRKMAKYFLKKGNSTLEQS
jgi:hypothetical protein